MARPKKPPTQPVDDDDEIDSSSWDDPAPDDDEELAAEASEMPDEEEPEAKEFVPEGPKSAKDKRRERGQLRQEIDRLRIAHEDQARQLAHFQGMAAQYPDANTLYRMAQGAQAQQVPQEDPVAKEVKACNSRIASIQREFTANAGRMPQARLDELQAEVLELEDRKMAAMVQRHTPKAQQQDSASIAREAIRMQVRAQNADIYGDERAAKAADGAYWELVAKGAPQSMETHDRAMNLTRERLGMNRRGEAGKPPARATQQERSRVSGVGRGATGSANGNKAAVTWHPSLQKLADHQFPDESDAKKRFQRWVNTSGREFLK